MILSEITNGIELTGNEVSFIASLIIAFLFYYQYRRYEEEEKNELMIEEFLSSLK
jgi:uncharacterized membrane protein